MITINRDNKNKCENNKAHTICSRGSAPTAYVPAQDPLILGLILFINICLAYKENKRPLLSFLTRPPTLISYQVLVRVVYHNSISYTQIVNKKTNLQPMEAMETTSEQLKIERCCSITR